MAFSIPLEIENPPKTISLISFLLFDWKALKMIESFNQISVQFQKYLQTLKIHKTDYGGYEILPWDTL